MRNKLYTFCLGIGLNMFFPEFFVILPAPPTPKEFFHRTVARRGKGKASKGYSVTQYNRTQVK